MSHLENLYDASGRLIPVSELADLIASKQLSILDALGASKLRKEMVPVGKLCGFVIRKIIKRSNRQYRCKRNQNYWYGRSFMEIARNNTLRILRIFAPVRVESSPEFTRSFSTPSREEISQRAYVVGFNHPSLGEIIRLMGVGMDIFPCKGLFFPVNLPWYESLIPYQDELDMLGIHLAPIITPATQRKILTIVGEDNVEVKKTLSNLNIHFLRSYMKHCCIELRCGSIVFIAPSATRQKTVYSESEAKTMEPGKIGRAIQAVAMRTAQDQIQCAFVPISVTPPKSWGKDLNLFKEYRLVLANYYSPDQTRDNIGDFGYQFLADIANHVPNAIIFP